LAEEEALADVARREWDRIGDGEPTPLTVREPQLAEARASVASTQKALAQAERDLDRTRVRAPFTGRVKEKLVDAGQFVTRGAPVGRIYAVDYAEVRLPLPGRDLAFLDLPLDGAGGADAPEVRLTTEFAGERGAWTGRIVRTEGEIDPRTRMVYAVARVENPYRVNGTGARFPLASGLFVEGEIQGRTVSGVVILPRSALRGSNEVLVVDEEDRLHTRRVDVLRAEDDTVVIGDGLSPGERVCLSSLDVVVDGMKVRTPQAPSIPSDPGERPDDETPAATTSQTEESAS
jgi:RND family efflux transporter MFP subunit